VPPGRTSILRTRGCGPRSIHRIRYRGRVDPGPRISSSAGAVMLTADGRDAGRPWLYRTRRLDVHAISRARCNWPETVSSALPVVKNMTPRPAGAMTSIGARLVRGATLRERAVRSGWPGHRIALTQSEHRPARSHRPPDWAQRAEASMELAPPPGTAADEGSPGRTPSSVVRHHD